MTNSKGPIAYLGWVVIIPAFIFACYLSFMVGLVLGEGKIPTAYAEGYCTALGGVMLNDETCNVDGKVVTIP
jgi:hypothetical protein